MAQDILEDLTGYSANGSAAYDIRRTGNAIPEQPRPELPKERRRPQKKKVQRVKGKLAIAPLSILGLVVAGCMLILVIFGYVQLYEATSVVSQLETELSSVSAEHESLLSEYEGKIDLATIEQRATQELGLMQPMVGQTYQVNLAGEDRAEVIQVVEISWFIQTIDAIRTSVEGLLAYLS